MSAAPERDLVASVMQMRVDALRKAAEAVAGARARGGRLVDLAHPCERYRDALGWFASPEFPAACELLDLDQRAVWQRLEPIIKSAEVAILRGGH